MTDDLVQIFNPRSQTYTIIDRKAGKILGHETQQLKHLPLVKPVDLRSSPGPVEYEIHALWPDGGEAKTVVEAHSMLGAVWQAAARSAAAGVEGEPRAIRAEVRHA